jgi:hypothetical protein
LIPPAWPDLRPLLTDLAPAQARGVLRLRGVEVTDRELRVQLAAAQRADWGWLPGSPEARQSRAVWGRLVAAWAPTREAAWAQVQAQLGTAPDWRIAAEMTLLGWPVSSGWVGVQRRADGRWARFPGLELRAHPERAALVAMLGVHTDADVAARACTLGVRASPETVRLWRLELGVPARAGRPTAAERRPRRGVECP